MRICIFSDTHGNLSALDAVLADMQPRGPFDLTVMAGDLALFGPRPAETIDRIRAMGCLVLMGNTDQYIVQNAQGAYDWIRAQLGAERLHYLAGLPFAYAVQPQAGHELLICHANPKDLEDHLRPDRPEAEVRALLDGVSAEVIAFGHIHTPYIRTVGAHTLFDIASVGLPRDGDTRAAYGIAAWTRNGWQLEHRRVAYDVEAVVADMRASGMPNAEEKIQILRSASY
ncbi:MAG: metallophosphoesterase family protein [Chloroflexota bacterium]